MLPMVVIYKKNGVETPLFQLHIKS